MAKAGPHMQIVNVAIGTKSSKALTNFLYFLLVTENLTILH